MRTFPLLGLVLLPSLHLAQGPPRTWIVDSFDAADAHFGVIQEAVDAAADGDTILIRPGAIYDGFTVEDKALVISAEQGSRVAFEIGDGIEVQDLAAGKTLVLRGLGADGSSPLQSLEPPLRASDCAGTLWLEDCSFSPRETVYGTMTEPGLEFTLCQAVVLVDCQVEGKPGVRSVASGMHVLSSTITCLLTPDAGLDLDGAFCFVSGSTIRGGPGVVQPTGSPCISDGGPGIRLGNASELYIQASAIEGGPVDTSLLVFCFLYGNPNGAGVAGPRVEQDPASLVVDLPGAFHATVFTPLVRDGQPLTRTFLGVPGELVYFFQSDEPEPVFQEFLSGTVFTPASTPFALLGSLDATGSLALTFPATMASCFDGTCFGQALFVDLTSAAAFAGSPATTTILDAGVSLRTGLDCNQNGVSDTDDLALGTSLDCNRDGTPDECQPFVPVVAQPIMASDGRADDGFGFALARDGDTLVVGAPFDSPLGTTQERGSVYVYERGANGLWLEVQRITYGGSGSVNFGSSVALEGDTLVVGIPRYTDFSTLPLVHFHGRAFVYERDGSGSWIFTQAIEVPVPVDGAGFGHETVLENGELVIAAPGTGYAGGCNSYPAVYAFRKVGGTWTLVQSIPNSVPSSGDCFGSSLALDGSSLAIGCRAFGSFPATGAVFLYELQDGSWELQQTVIPEDVVGGDFDGWGVAVGLRGGVLAAGASFKHHARIQGGVVYAYERDALGAWQPSAVSKLVPLGITTSQLGSQVAMAEDVILTSSPVNGSIDSALALFTRRADGRWSRHQTSAIESATTISALLPVDDQILVGLAEGDGLVAGSGVVLAYELEALITANPCILSGPKPARQAPGLQPR